MDKRRKGNDQGKYDKKKNGREMLRQIILEKPKPKTFDLVWHQHTDESSINTLFPLKCSGSTELGGSLAETEYTDNENVSVSQAQLFQQLLSGAQ